MWLLDMNMPKGLVAMLRQFEVEAQHVASRDWGGLKNGELAGAAVDDGFTCLLTRDRLFGESASRALNRFPGFAVVLLTLPQLRWPQFRNAFRRHWEAVPIRPEAGSVSRWPIRAEIWEWHHLRGRSCSFGCSHIPGFSPAVLVSR